jgi:hypothetical protein
VAGRSSALMYLLGDGAQFALPWRPEHYRLLFSNFDDVVSVLELHERELIEETLATKKAVTAFRKVEHEAAFVMNAGPPRPPTSISIGWK